MNAINESSGTTVPSLVTLISDQYESSDQNIITNLYQYLSSYQGSTQNFNPSIQSISQNTIIQMAADDSPQPNATLLNALQYLIAQMVAGSQSVLLSHVSSNYSANADNIGNPNIVINLYDQNNNSLQMCFAERQIITCSQDSQSNSALAGSEIMLVQGQQAVTNSLSYQYPAGSGVSTRIQTVNGMQAGGGLANWLINGSFETWTSANIPATWHIGTGTPGTTVIQSSSIFYDGLYSMQFLGNGSEMTAIYQQFSTVAGRFDITSSTIYPNSLICFNCWLRIGPSVPSSGVLQISLSNGTSPILDNSGSSNSESIILANLSTSWVPVSATFRTPNQLPSSGVFLSLALTTPLPSGYSVYIDRVSVCSMTQLYSGGPYISIFSGNTNLIQGNGFVANIANDYEGEFNILFDRLFGMRSLGLIIPYSATPTIPNSLIT